MQRLFAAALDGDPVAEDALRNLALDDNLAAAAFEALMVADCARRARLEVLRPLTPGELARAEQILAAVHDPARHV